MDWNSYIEKESEAFVTLPEGDYDYTITGFEKSEHPGSAKVPACPKAVIELTISVPGIGKSVVTDQLLLHENVEWKLCEFFRSIGQKTHGKGVTMNWDKVLGAKGRAHIFVDTWIGQDGSDKQKNKVKRYLDPETELGGGQEW